MEDFFETGKGYICLGIIGLEIQCGWSEERALGNMEGRRNYQTVMTFLGRWCSALLERATDVLSIIPHRINHEFKLWKVLVFDFSASASLSHQKKIMVCVFFQDEFALGL